MLPCVCSVIDHRWRQNVGRTKKWHTRPSRVCLFYFKIFQHNAKLHEEKPFDVIWSIQNEAISLVAIRSKELWLVEKNRATVKPVSSVAPCWMKTLQRKQNWTAKSTNLEENAGKIKSVFVIGAALWAEKLGSCLENYRSWNNTLGKLVVTVNLEAIWFEFWMKGA